MAETLMAVAIGRIHNSSTGHVLPPSAGRREASGCIAYTIRRTTNRLPLEQRPARLGRQLRRQRDGRWLLCTAILDGMCRPLLIWLRLCECHFSTCRVIVCFRLVFTASLTISYIKLVKHLRCTRTVNARDYVVFEPVNL